MVLRKWRREHVGLTKQCRWRFVCLRDCGLPGLYYYRVLSLFMASSRGPEVAGDTATRDSQKHQSLRDVSNEATAGDRTYALDDGARESRGPHDGREGPTAGPSQERVKIPDVHNEAHSDCNITRAPSDVGSVSRSARSYSAERRYISAAISRSIPKEDLIAVWNLIAGVVASRPQECFLEDGQEPPGKRIEDAARLVARSAEEWGHVVEEEGQGTSRTPRTPGETRRLARQAARIRATALQIAKCARDWGDKLERKRSSSRLRR
ncbi:hypothetical protein LX36DRAFT_311251 [Colletotrichum falcatum]|nr:hypothetical protein LX36DRAFT_311251 [Colletotrichum falcatum]